MSSLIDRFQEKEVLAALGIFAIAAVILIFITDFSPLVNIILAGLFAGGLYLLYSDIQEKNRLKDAESAKEDDLKKRIEAQAQVELESGKCVSCTADIPAGAENCPNCGYKVKHYTSIDKKN